MNVMPVLKAHFSMDVKKAVRTHMARIVVNVRLDLKLEESACASVRIIICHQITIDLINMFYINLDITKS